MWEYLKYGIGILFGSGIFVEIVPFIKWNPISSILGWLGNKLNRDVKQEIEVLKSDIKSVKTGLQDHIVESQRRNILNFSDKLMRGEKKTKEDFQAIIKMHDSYDKYITENNIPNGQIDLAFAYISKKYQECIESNSFYNGK